MTWNDALTEAGFGEDVVSSHTTGRAEYANYLHREAGVHVTAVTVFPRPYDLDEDVKVYLRFSTGLDEAKEVPDSKRPDVVEFMAQYRASPAMTSAEYLALSWDEDNLDGFLRFMAERAWVGMPGPKQDLRPQQRSQVLEDR